MNKSAVLDAEDLLLKIRKAEAELVALRLQQATLEDRQHRNHRIDFGPHYYPAASGTVVLTKSAKNVNETKIAYLPYSEMS